MLDDFQIALRAGSQQFADATRPAAAGLIRARGNQRQHRRAALGAALAAAVIAGGAVAAAGTIGGQHRRPVPVLSHRGFSLRLTVPARYSFDVPNPVSFTIDNQGRSRTVTVDLNLGRSRYAVYRKAILQRLDRAGTWVTVPLTRRASGWTARYPLRIDTGVTSQRLLIVPAMPVSAPDPLAIPPLTVRIMSGPRILAERRSAAGALVVTLTGSWVRGSPAAGHGRTYPFAFTLRNPASVGYPAKLFFFALLCPAGPVHCGHPPAGDKIQWLDGTTWRTVQASAYSQGGHHQLLKTVRLPAGGQVTVSLRLIIGPRALSGTAEMFFLVRPDTAHLPGPAARYPPMSSVFTSGIIRPGVPGPG